MHPILSTTFTQRISFAEPPPYAIRLALIAAGFSFNGAFWVATNGTTSAVHLHDLARILAAMTPEQTATA